ncbi:hypothetical protein PVAND_012455 [Polypedilum vanderplanki]|uniref:Lipase domain-containing protein n=1 Tax=Polypedilum vanderplanki TaxID=319348 RepID=A0A9J6CMG8_POLVA|nr:hypothetical protein PVAND_012455 [Polypedilum vanderplanki]
MASIEDEWLSMVNEGRQNDDDECQYINNRTCPDSEIRFYLFTQSNVNSSQFIFIDSTTVESSMTNLSASYFNASNPTKIIIHGFRGDMYQTPLYRMREEYLNETSMNIFYVDWFNLSSSFCYPAVVHNIKHVGECTSMLIRKLVEAGNADIHIIGFSLGAQVTNFIAESLKPEIILPRISGLDPAMPWFITVDNSQKLDKSDAKFVDVYHCNSLVQAKIETCGHVDFYFNNAIIQPGCDGNFFACSHQRCADYFMESIQTKTGFYGRQCDSYLLYLLNQCEHHKANMLAGEHCNKTTTGMYFINTNSKFPFAKGQFYDTNENSRSMSDMRKEIRNLQQFCNNLTDENLKQFLNCKQYEVILT